MNSLFHSDNPVFAGYVFYSAILMFKMLLMSMLTGFTRYKKKAYVNAEDAVIAGTTVKPDEDEDVERIRRAHLNDLENIPLFLISGLLFVAADPNVIFALMMFRLYTLARLVHTIVYVLYPLPQPTRSVSFFVGLIVNLTLIITLIVCFPQP